MLRLVDGSIVLAATDLTNHVACAHLTQQRLAIARGQRPKARPVDDPHAELIRTRGDRHEQEQLERLAAECGGYVDVSSEEGLFTRDALESAAAKTLDAMRSGVPLIFQAQLFDGTWQGRADFLRRVAGPSGLGDVAYEVLDTKLAKQVKPHVVHQLCLYNRLLGLAQGVEPALAHLVLGDGSIASVDLRRYAALHRYVAAQLERIVVAPAQVTYPEPVPHCDICALAAECRDRRVADDHLSLVAGARRDHRERLAELGLATVLGLAQAPEEVNAVPIHPQRFSLLRHQALLQVESRTSGIPVHRHLPPARAAGYAVLPPPSDGDVFFDLEGDPYVGAGGLEYLWGWWTAGSGYEYVWAHDGPAERSALERFVDRVLELRALHPDMHVFHYAPHERSKLRSLSIQYATRENEVDELLRNEVLVDLYAVVKQGMQVGEESYSLKKLERHHGFQRLEKRVRAGGGSIVAYETWLETADDDLLEAIRAYNEEDCTSTLSLRDWLLRDMRPEAEAALGVDFDDYREPEPEDGQGAPDWMPKVEAIIAKLAGGLPEATDDDSADDAERRLVMDLLLYHHREGKPAWWRYYDLRGKPVADLIEDRDAIGGLVRDESRPPTPHKRSLDYVFTFPTQECRLDVGDADDPTTGERFNVVRVREDHVVLRRGNTKPPPAPVALVEGPPVNARVLRDALIELAESLLAQDGRWLAVRSLLRREPPRLKSGRLDEDLDALVSATLGLDRSVLPVQGPPGTGKTYRGARMVVAALAAGKRVGITAPSHSAIQNLLRAVEEHSSEQGHSFAGIYKGSGYEGPHGLIEETGSYDAVGDEHLLVAGTAWLFARKEHREAFDLLFVDEAGQFALADAVAVGLSTANVVLLGDPQQLPQITQAGHPGGSGASVLEHLLQGASTIPPGRGVLLTETWRMHPEVCAFVSERSYDSRLRARAACDRRRVDAKIGDISGVGLRALAVEHDGRTQASPEEAEAIAAACRNLLAGATVTDDQGVPRTLVPDDLMVVAPYNLAVRCIRDRVPAGVRVGTVDRFQGRQAPVVFFAMTCSSAEEVPRGPDFLFDAHRLNVAISRAECIAVLVHSPRLLDADCPTLKTMELVDGVCRFVEMAGSLPIPSGSSVSHATTT
jgi:predicted RecB family nuclease